MLRTAVFGGAPKAGREFNGRAFWIAFYTDLDGYITAGCGHLDRAPGDLLCYVHFV